eukprot:gene10169-11208_t
MLNEELSVSSTEETHKNHEIKWVDTTEIKKSLHAMMICLRAASHRRDSRIEIGNHSEAWPHGLGSDRIHRPVKKIIEKDESIKDKISFKENWITHKKAILFLIDGLRYDFIQHHPNLTDKDSKHYQNKLVKVNELVSNNPENAKIFKFVADPPTITVQRVKGLTTGSLPTFADATSNFGSAKIPEDNIIHQLHKNNKSVVFIGDEIWLDMYPNYFKRQYSYPSLDAKDLDGADDGIKEHLIPEMKKKDWTVIIAHGLDNLDNDTIMYVFGDHGMTQGGDHGGESDEETVAAMMTGPEHKVIAQVDLVPTLALQLGIPIPFSNIGTVIEDMFMLEEGSHITDEQGKSQKDSGHNMNRVLALRYNSLQVMQYLAEYSKVSQDIGEEKFLQLREMFIDAEQSFNKIKFATTSVSSTQENATLESDNISITHYSERQYREFVREVLDTCREIWAKFDLVSTALGLIFMLLTSFSGTFIIWSTLRQGNREYRVSFSLIQYSGLALNCVSWLLNTNLLVSASSSVLLISLQLLSLLCLVSFFWTKKISNTEHIGAFMNGRLNKIALAVFTFYLCGLSSNSYIMHENAVLLGLIQFLLFGRMLSHVSIAVDNSKNKDLKHYEKLNSRKRQKKREQNLKVDWHFIVRALLLLIASFCARLAMNFWKCREDQTDCEISSFLKPMETLMYEDSFMFKLRLYLAIPSVLATVFSCYYWCKKNGHLVGNSFIYISTQVCIPMSAFCIILHWALQTNHDKKLAAIFDLPWVQQVFFPRVVYAAFTLVVIFVLWDPLGVCLILRQCAPLHKPPLRGSSFDQNIQAVFRSMRDKLNEVIPSESQDSPPLVYGLATVYTAAYYTLTVASAIVLMMLLSDGIAPSVLLLCVTLCCLLVDESFRYASQSSFTGPDISSLILWSLVSSYWFFGLGHQATIPAIRFDAAFIGRQGDSGARFIPGLLIFLNTYASNILCCFALPLLCIWSISKHGSASNWIPASKNDPLVSNDLGEMALRENPRDTFRMMFLTVLTFIVLAMFKVAAIAAFVALHRRHLLIWNAFAPRFVFEAAGFLFSTPFLFAGVLFFIRIDVALEKWAIHLEEISKRE